MAITLSQQEQTYCGAGREGNFGKKLLRKKLLCDLSVSMQRLSFLWTGVSVKTG